MTKKDELEIEIRQVCTYYSDDPCGGTCGYLLGEKHFKKLFALYRSYSRQQVRGVLDWWDQAIFYSDLGKGKLDKKVMKNHYKLAKEGYDQEG